MSSERHPFRGHEGSELDCTAYGKCHEPTCLKPESDPVHAPERQRDETVEVDMRALDTSYALNLDGQREPSPEAEKGPE